MANDGSSRSSHATVVVVTMVLTDKGLLQAGGLGGEMMMAVWEYLAMLRVVGPQEWVWREMAQLAVSGG